MVVSSAVCLLILNGDGKVITASPLALEALDFVVLVLGKGRPIRLVLSG